MKWLTCLLALGTLLLWGGPARAAITKIEPDPRAVQLITDFLKACQVEDEGARLKAVLPLLHKSMLNSAGTDLDAQVKQFSYKKACSNAHFYEVPAVIKEVHQGKTQTVGFQKTGERGRVDKYFVVKKSGVPGVPAPLHVFWPEDGGAPVLINIGSL